MKTNQMMTVRIGNFGTVQIGHLTRICKLNDVLDIGNLYRENAGLRKIEIREWLVKESTWEFIIEVERKYGDLFQTPDSGVCFSDYKNSHGKIEFSNLIKKFSVIKSQRGGKPENRGYWANLFILIDLASFMSPLLKLEMYEVFVEKQILTWRDVGGENFKEFNEVVDTLPDRKGQNNQGVYIQVSKIIRHKLDIIDSKGYNEEEHNAIIQKKRSEYLKSLKDMVNVGLITNYPQLKDILNRL
jgi:hypothetical protein